jgi:ribosome-associated heat shock protein Hsp15
VAERPNAAAGPASAAARLDKWLWQARFFRARAAAAETVAAGQVRLNGQRVTKPGHVLRPGDTLTFPQGGRIRLIRVAATGSRRGPAAEAERLYIDLDAAQPAPRPLEGPAGFD